MRIQDDWCRMMKASPRPWAWLGLGWIGSLSAAGWSANSGLRFRLNFDQVSFFAPRCTGGPQKTKINLKRHRSGLRTLISVRGGL